MKQYVVDAFTDKVFHGNQAAIHRIKTEANSVIHSPEGRHVEVTMLTGLAENLDALLPQFYKDIPDKLKEQTEENMQ